MALPIRTCIGCRKRDAAAELVRLALLDGAVVLANRSSRTGRGASLHVRPACLELGLRPDVLSRAFKRRVTIPDATKLLEQITKVENRGKR